MNNDSDDAAFVTNHDERDTLQRLHAENVTLAISKLYFYKLCFKFTINNLYYIFKKN